MAIRVTRHASPLLLQRGVRGRTGDTMEVMVHLPMAPALSARGFEFDSAFPGQALLGSVPELMRAAHQHPSARLMLFGHADEAGSVAYNKNLSERRAKAAFALITRDQALFDAVAKEDGWGLIQYQAMMSSLGIAPMKVDGKPGPITRNGVALFQEAYNTRVYHPEGTRDRAHGSLKVDGALGPRTEAALRDAYLGLIPVALDAARFMGPKTVGCSEFNRMGSPEQDRRVTLALYGPDFPSESKVPCRDGDAGSCKINKQKPLPPHPAHPWTCNFYRRTIEAERPATGTLRSAHPRVAFEVPAQKGALPAQQSWIALLTRQEPILLASADPDFVPAVRKQILAADQNLRAGAASANEATREKAADTDAKTRATSAKLHQEGREQHEKRDKDDTGPNVENAGFIAFAEVDRFQPPKLAHDHGFLDSGNGIRDVSLMEPPTEADRDSLLRWKAKARLAQLLRPDLSEAVAAYLHFLNGSGAYLAVNYDDYVESDKAGQRTLQSLVEDIRFSAFELHRALGGGTRNFLMQSDVVAAGDFKKDGTPANGRYPYPGTENWQKTIGAHLLWVEAEVSAHEESSAVVCDVIATVKVEDMYNFNPDNVDIATGIPDSENGRFEIVGLGHEFLSKATLVRRIRFSASRDGVSSNGLDERVEVKKP